jgi:predicted permease
MFKRVFRLRAARETVDDDLEAELRFHFDRAVGDLVAAGLSRDAARREALRRFGDLQFHRHNIQDLGRRRAAMLRRREWLDITRQHLGYALRSVRRSPGFTAAVVVTLGLGIGANATMFGIVDRILFKPPSGVAEAEQVRRMFVNRDFLGRTVTTRSITYPDFLDFDAADRLTGTAAYWTEERTLRVGESSMRVRASDVTGSFFDVLGVNPAYGRLFTSDEDRPGQPGLAVLSHRLWNRQFAGAADVLGRVLTIGNGRYTVVGVAPAGFTGAELSRVDVWLSLHAAGEHEMGTRWRASRGTYWLTAIARLQRGVSLETAESEATALHRGGRSGDTRYDPEASITLAPLLDALGPRASDESVVTRWLAGVSLIVLLVACANVANLLLARGVRARREVAIRLALGVSRRRLIGQLLTESLVFAAIGGIAALVFTRWGGDAVRTLLLPDVAWLESPVNLRVLLFTSLATGVTGIVAGLVPAMQSSRPDVTGALKGFGGGGPVRHSKTRGAFLVVQGAFSVILLIGAGLFVRSVSRVQSLDLGMDTDRIVVVSLDVEGASNPTPELRTRLNQIFQTAAERVRTIAGVDAASAAQSLQFWSSFSTSFRVPGRDSIPTLPTGGPYVNRVTREYFSTMGMTVLRGRGFGPGDHHASAARVAIIDETMARLIWPEEDPLGQCVLIGRGEDVACTEIIGIAKDSRRQSITEDDVMQYFAPWEQAVVATTLNTLLVRTAGAPGALVETVRREVQAIDPAIRFANVRPLQQLIDPQIRSWRLGATMFTAFGGLALVVAGIGLYSVLAFGVAQRTHELGVRAALGATAGTLSGLVFGEGMLFTALGVGLGTVVAFLAGPAVAPLLYDVSPRDPAVFGIVIATLAMVAVVASVVPAWRTTRIDPTTALRAE